MKGGRARARAGAYQSDMPQRELAYFDIAHRHAEVRGMVAADDFRLVRRQAPCPFPEAALAYCADLAAERVLYTCHGEGLDALFAAPFLYGPQLREARQVVSVPFERLSAFELAVPIRPTLIFSPGRAGSTLLVRVLAACGAPCASEPDMLTQICRLERQERQHVGTEMEGALLRACLTALCRALGPAPFIKLRSQCNARPQALAMAACGPVILLMRARVGWARSRHLAFGEPPALIAAMLRQWLDAVDKLLAAPVPPLVIWFEDFSRDALAVAAACLPGVPVCGQAVTLAMRTDSQAGTSIARSALARGMVPLSFDAAFDQAWARARAGAEWNEATRPLLERLG